MQSKEIINNLLKKTDYITKVQIYFSSKVAGDDYDKYEANYTETKLNPITIKAYVREVTSEQAYYKQYGKQISGMKELLCEERYHNYFENCSLVKIDGDSYQVFKDGTNKTLITSRPFKTLRVVLSRL